jgi:DNA-binding response OmpR family regulator
MEPGRRAMKPRVLVIDDDEAIRELVMVSLNEDFAVKAAADGRSGLAVAAIEQPDLIVLDVMMPRMNGWQALGELKADPLTRYIPVIMLTALDQTEDKVKGLTTGAEDYMAKPFDPAELAARARLVLARAAVDKRIDPTTLLMHKAEAEHELENRLDHSDKAIAVSYITIRSFDRVVDALGAERADRLLKWTAGALRSVTDAREPDAAIGFLGESTFIYIGTPAASSPACMDLIKRFDSERSNILFAGKGFLPQEAALAIAVVNAEEIRPRTVESIRHRGAEILGQAKKVHGSVLLTDRECVRVAA